MARSKKSAGKKPAKKKAAVKKAAPKKAAKKKAAVKKAAPKKRAGKKIFIPDVRIDKNVNIVKKLKHDDHPEFIRIGYEENGERIK